MSPPKTVTIEQSSDTLPPAFATPAALQKRWECSAMKIRRWMRNGKLPYHVFGRHVRIAWDDILRVETSARVEFTTNAKSAPKGSN